MGWKAAVYLTENAVNHGAAGAYTFRPPAIVRG